ncbi:MAG: S8 family serine peptidase [Thiocapsa sp.]|uniref:S8 family serine peptidase n=1 Tax=Thiocapsa sp. TaxID=2024551 RepID=UPI001BCF8BF5|nr:S8 family serine peptidase [Thiocapsa sp.]QVL50936.1 MAG: S8 family serine peptidase [Thiocapsa sp.]
MNSTISLIARKITMNIRPKVQKERNVVRRAKNASISVTLAFVAGFAAMSTSSANSAIDAPNAPNRSVELETKTGQSTDYRGAPSEKGVAHRELLDQAQSLGRVPVIVKLKTWLQPESILDHDGISQQREVLSTMQQRVLDDLSATSGRDQAAMGIKRFALTPAFAMQASESDILDLLAHPDVLDVVEDSIMLPFLMDSVPLIGGLDGSFRGYTGQGQVVAVLDTGVDKNHPFLRGKVVAEACYSSNVPALGATSLCPGSVSESTASGSGINCPVTLAGCDHGTHVAGIAAGQSDSFSGVARDADIIAAQIFSRFNSVSICGSTAPCIRTFTSDSLRALERIYLLRTNHSIAVINMSLGGGAFTGPCNDDARRPIIDQLRTAGIATVAASGNEGYINAISAPACVSSAISVGSTSKADQISIFSNSAYFLDLLAPGESIYSAVTGTGYASKSGTSMATPHVAGAWAVIKSAQPAADPDTILSTLKSTGMSLTDVNDITTPRVQVDRAVDEIAGTQAAINTAVLPYARAVAIAETATAFASVINSGDATALDCLIALPTGIPATLSYQTTTAANALTGSPNTPVDIAAGATQGFVFGITPSQAMAATEIPLVFDCANTAPAASYPGLNTFILSAAATAPPDLLAIGATPSGDGVVRLPSRDGTGFFATAAVNIGSAGSITVSADDGGRGLPLSLRVCETTPAGEWIVCGNNLTRSVGAAQTAYYSVFATGTGQPIAFDPANNRLFLRFAANGRTVGATNVAVTAP